MKGMTNAPGKAGYDLETVKASVNDLNVRAAEAKDAADEAKKAAEDAKKAADAALNSLTDKYYTIATVPVQKGTLTYNGNTLEPEWDYYDPQKINRGGYFPEKMPESTWRSLRLPASTTGLTGVRK